ncbi:heme-binding protein 2-like [Lytechinus variegatus]|uniref:heme-binding protein 2-like n=1 Tax=Lytechinus variegatus TaxID=7654 RepID=UPI001BB255A1|nr:heme-binding protein 2-like [Lytechinus variegatus]
MKSNMIISLFIMASMSLVHGRVVSSNHGNTATKKNGPPSFCNGLDCPKYSVVDDTHQTWEERQYSASSWASTTLSGVAFDQAQEQMFMKLFEYIQGENELGVKIEMAVPVTLRATIDARTGHFNDDYTLSFYLPYKYQNATAPKPKNPDIFLRTEPQSKIFVRSFPGYMSETKDLFNAGALAADLKDEWGYDHGYIYTAGYDSPWKVFSRHNEVWFMAKN